MRFWFAAAFCLGLSSLGASAQEGMDEERRAVLQCVESMVQEEDWNICLGMMFAPCAGNEVGSEGHLMCLENERKNWRTTFDGQFQTVSELLTTPGSVELGEIIGQWEGFVSSKCWEVARGFEGSGAQAAQIGCEISEIVGVSAELMACLEGNSTAPYCQMREN